jgi:hypothetical protein
MTLRGDGAIEQRAMFVATTLRLQGNESIMNVIEIVLIR